MTLPNTTSHEIPESNDAFAARQISSHLRAAASVSHPLLEQLAGACDCKGGTLFDREEHEVLRAGLG